MMLMLNKLRYLFWVGIIILFLPYIGIPNNIKSILTIILGFVIIFLSIKIKKNYKMLKLKIYQLENTNIT